MSFRLGIYDGHNSSAVLFSNGKPVYALQEERLSRIKNHFDFPVQAIRKVMEMAGIQPADVGAVCISSKYVAKPKKPHQMVKDFEVRYEKSPKRSLINSIGQNPYYGAWRKNVRMAERKELAVSMGFNGRTVQFYDHHLAHAASAYFGLKKDDSRYLVITADGSGDGVSSGVWVAENGRMTRVAVSSYIHSIGEIYAVTTHYLGFVPLEHEYKLMGMAPYASAKQAAEVCEIYSRYLDMDPQNPMEFKSKVPEPLSMIGPRLERDLRRCRFDSICAGLQLFSEQLLCKWVKACIKETGVRRVLASGGVFMNVKANKRISEIEELDYFEAFPSCGDESLPFGACYLSAVQDGEITEPLTNYYFGCDISQDGAFRAVKSDASLKIEEPGDMAARVAQLLEEGTVVARAAGPMEFGARALGNRSILGDPINQDLVRVINRMIKKRDFWMPFAPVVLKEESGKYMVNPKNLPSAYMMQSFDTTDARLEFMAAVHNADLTARPQIVEKGQNAGYEGILKEFKKRTGRAVLLNTSFNLHGFPIVCTPEDALGVLKESGLKCLLLGPFIVWKKGE